MVWRRRRAGAGLLPDGEDFSCEVLEGLTGNSESAFFFDVNVLAPCTEWPWVPKWLEVEMRRSPRTGS